MTISGISGPGSIYQPSTTQSGFSEQFGDLVSSLNSDNLSGIQQAYSALSQLQSSGQGPAAGSSNPVSQALSGSTGSAVDLMT